MATAKRRATLVGNHPVCTSVSMDEAYEANDIIGKGSFGIIRKVKRRADGMILARKELNYGRMDERDLKQLTEEVNILEQLGSNEYIVRYYERFVDKPNTMLYILMEYCEGGDLGQVIHRCRSAGSYLSEESVWSYLAQITLALNDCHSEVDASGQPKPVILHRDLKPDNVFLDRDNNLKLGDFGLSKKLQAEMTRTYVGTPYYMSPELLNGQPYDIKSDIWALGCLMYEVCTGRPPFHEARTQPELASMVREGKFPDLPKVYSPHLNQVVRAMLKQNPRHRPSTTQIKALDNVKLQIRVFELRKATRELRVRDQQIAAREQDLLAREAAVLAREHAVLLRETNTRNAEITLRANLDALKEREAALTASESLQQKEKQEEGSFSAGDENTRPGVTPEELRARVASRPSLISRRPLEERRSSGNFAVSGVPFPRLSSASSLMSLDDTPLKDRMSLFNKRQVTKSMHDMNSHYFTEGSPMVVDLTHSPIPRSLSPTKIHLENSEKETLSTSAESETESTTTPSLDVSPPVSTANPPFKPTPPSPTKPSRVFPTVPAKYDVDDLPSPFIKRMEGTRICSLPTAAITKPGRVAPGPKRPSRISISNTNTTKPSMASRLLATRAVAAAKDAGGALVAHVNNKTTA